MTVAEKTTGFESTTPSGIRVYYQTEPKRLYKVNDVEVPSVTTVLKCLDKPGLPWWGMKVGIAGTLEMIRQGKVGRYDGQPVCVTEHPRRFYDRATEDNVTDLLKQHKLTVNHTLSKAGDRGTSVHAGLEKWCEDRTIPDPDYYPEEERGYVVGLVKFLTDLKLSARPKLLQETMVGSAEHGFAGRYDLACNLDECELVTNVTPVRGEKREVFPKGRYLLDLKTSAGVYDTHFLQLEAYEQASIECGYGPTAFRAVVRVDKAGYYEVKVSKATFYDFHDVLRVHQMLEDLKGRK